MTNKLTTAEQQTIDTTAKAMTAQKISREQMLIIDNALAIIRYTLEIET